MDAFCINLVPPRFYGGGTLSSNQRMFDMFTFPAGVYHIVMTNGLSAHNVFK